MMRVVITNLFFFSLYRDFPLSRFVLFLSFRSGFPISDFVIFFISQLHSQSIHRTSLIFFTRCTH